MRYGVSFAVLRNRKALELRLGANEDKGVVGSAFFYDVSEFAGTMCKDAIRRP